MSHTKKPIITAKELILLLVLIPSLFLSLIISKEQQTIKQQAQIAGCGKPGDKGNELGVGKYCTKTGNECAGTGAPYCAILFKSDVPPICSKPCATDNDCGSGAKCSGSGLEKGCEPIACSAPPPTNTPVPTKVPTATPKPQATSTPVPTSTPPPQPTIEPTLPLDPTPTTPQDPTPTMVTMASPTPTLAPNTAALALRVFLHGIGNSGDNANPVTASLSNKNPVRTVRPVTVTIFNAGSELMMTREGIMIYDNTSGAFNGVVSLGADIASGNYVVKIKSDGYLRKQLSGIQNIQPSILTAPDVSLVAGDVNGDNTVNTLDYNGLLECFSDILSRTCNETTKQMTDFNDDGKVNQVDYNLLLREISVQNGD